MSIFGTLKNAIFGHAPTQASSAPPVNATKQAAAQTPPPAPSGAGISGQSGVDVEAVLEGLKAKNGDNLNWRTSIVDLMKLVGMDSSLQHRKDLAKELGYTGNTEDSGAMNIWLHKQVMARLAENGGKVPDSLLH
jgi:Domain of unknown function (DUF3597)